MAAHHVDLPDQVVSPGEELWVKIIDLDLERRRISLSIKQAAEGGTVAAEYQDMYGEHAYDEAGNYIGPAFEEHTEGAEAPAGGAEGADVSAQAAGGAEAAEAAEVAGVAEPEADEGGEPEADEGGEPEAVELNAAVETPAPGEAPTV
jgi:small subunit ribosomal protein S1